MLIQKQIVGKTLIEKFKVRGDNVDHRFGYKPGVDKHMDDDYEYSGKVHSYKEKVYNRSNNYENSEVTYKNNNKNYKFREEKQSDKGHKNSDEKDYIDIDEIYKNNDKKHSHKADTYKGKNYSHSESQHSDKVYKHSEKGFIFDDNLIEEVVNVYSDMVYRIALNILCNVDDADDMMQEVFLRLIRSKNKIKSREHIKHWLIKVTINCSKSKVTENYKKHTVSISEISESYASCSNEIDETIGSVMKLPEKYKVPIHLYYYQQLTVDEISKILGITRSGVRSRLSRGRNMLKEILEKEDNNE